MGRGKKISLRTRDKAQAKAAFNRLKRDCFLQHVAVLEGRSTIRLEAFVQEYLEYAQNHKSPNTCRADRLALDKLLAEFGPQKILEQISSRDLEKFLGRLKATGLRDTSLAVYYRHMKAAFANAKQWRLIRENPFAEIKEPKGQEAVPRYLSSEGDHAAPGSRD